MGIGCFWNDICEIDWKGVHYITLEYAKKGISVAFPSLLYFTAY